MSYRKRKRVDLIEKAKKVKTKKRRTDENLSLNNEEDMVFESNDVDVNFVGIILEADITPTEFISDLQSISHNHLNFCCSYDVPFDADLMDRQDSEESDLNGDNGIPDDGGDFQDDEEQIPSTLLSTSFEQRPTELNLLNDIFPNPIDEHHSNLQYELRLSGVHGFGIGVDNSTPQCDDHITREYLENKGYSTFDIDSILCEPGKRRIPFSSFSIFSDNKILLNHYDLHESVLDIDWKTLLELDKLEDSKYLKDFFCKYDKKMLFKGSSISVGDFMMMVFMQTSKYPQSDQSVCGWLKLFDVVLSELEDVNILTSFNYLKSKMQSNIKEIGFCLLCQRTLFVDHIVFKDCSYTCDTLPKCKHCESKNVHSSPYKLSKHGKLILKDSSFFCYSSIIYSLLMAFTLDPSFEKDCDEVFMEIRKDPMGFIDVVGEEIMASISKKDGNGLLVDFSKLCVVLCDWNQDGFSLYKGNNKSINLASLRVKMLSKFGKLNVLMDKIVFPVSTSTHKKERNANLTLYPAVMECMLMLDDKVLKNQKILKLFPRVFRLDHPELCSLCVMKSSFCPGCRTIPLTIPVPVGKPIRMYSEPPLHERTVESNINDIYRRIETQTEGAKGLSVFTELNNHVEFDYIRKCARDFLHPVKNITSTLGKHHSKSFLTKLSSLISLPIRSENSTQKVITELLQFTYLEMRNWNLNVAPQLMLIDGDFEDETKKCLFICQCIFREIIYTVMNDNLESKKKRLDFCDLGKLFAHHLLKLSDNKEFKVLAHQICFELLKSRQLHGPICLSDTDAPETDFSYARRLSTTKNKFAMNSLLNNMSFRYKIELVFNTQLPKFLRNKTNSTKKAFGKFIEYQDFVNETKRLLSEVDAKMLFSKSDKTLPTGFVEIFEGNTPILVKRKELKKWKFVEYFANHPKAAICFCLSIATRNFCTKDVEIKLKSMLESQSCFSNDDIEDVKIIFERYSRQKEFFEYFKFCLDGKEYISVNYRKSQSQNGNGFVKFVSETNGLFPNDPEEPQQPEKVVGFGNIFGVFSLGCQSSQFYLLLHCHKRISKISPPVFFPDNIRYTVPRVDVVSKTPCGFEVISSFSCVLGFAKLFTPCKAFSIRDDVLKERVNKSTGLHRINSELFDLLDSNGECAFVGEFVSNKRRLK